MLKHILTHEHEDSLRVCMFVLGDVRVSGSTHDWCVCIRGKAMTLRSGIAMMSYVNHAYRRYNISVLFFKGLNGLLLKYAHLCGNWSDVVIRISFIHSVLCTELETPRYGGWSWDTNGYCKPSEMCWWCRWYHWIQKTPFLSILASCFICYCLQGILFRSVWLSTALIMDEDTEETLGAN